jgi:PIN domain nuclease of toxin-antitoxin system
MNLLLDTHILLWALADDSRLPAVVRAAVADGRNRVLVSAASSWEIAIKKALGKLRSPDDLIEQVEHARFEPLDITIEHTLGVAELPLHHADPFDRLLVAQARADRLTLVTMDPKLQPYEVDLLPRR